LLKFRSAVLPTAVSGKLLLEWPQAPFLWASAEIFTGGINVDILLVLFRLLTTQCKRTLTKRFTLSTQKEIAPLYGNCHKNAIRWQCCMQNTFGNSQVYCGKLQNRLSANFSSRVPLFKEANCDGL